MFRNCEKELEYLDMLINAKKSCCLRIGPRFKGKKVKVGFLYSATYTANQNSALHNIGSGS